MGVSGGGDAIVAAAVAVRGRGGAMKLRPVSWAAASLADSPATIADLVRRLLESCKVGAADVAALGWAGPSGPRMGAPASALGGDGMEVLSPAALAKRTGIAVAADFAAGDRAAGGIGGPVWAWSDWLLFRDKRLSRVVVHLGAVAGISFVGSDAVDADVVALHTGPGLAALDACACELFGQPRDIDGQLASRGRGSPSLLNELMSHPYFRQPPPKLTDPRDWQGVYLQRVRMMADKHNCRSHDLLATLTELTARTIAAAVAQLTERPHQVILGGAGARNIHLAARIRALLSPSSTIATDPFGIAAEAHDAICYAALAAARLAGVPSNCPAATGAASRVCMGSLVLP